MHMGDEPAPGVERKQSFEWRIGMDTERLHRIECIEFIVGEYAPGRDREVVGFRFGDMEKIAGDTGKDEGDCHDRAVGVECPGDSEDERDGDDDL